MDGSAKPVARYELKLLVAEASQALARLDASRLEEMALSCAALNRDLMPLSAAGRRALAEEAREAAGEMAILARVLEATRANLRVMKRLRELRMGRLEYGERPEREPVVPEWIAEEPGAGGSHGHD